MTLRGLFGGCSQKLGFDRVLFAWDFLRISFEAVFERVGVVFMGEGERNHSLLIS